VARGGAVGGSDCSTWLTRTNSITKGIASSICEAGGGCNPKAAGGGVTGVLPATGSGWRKLKRDRSRVFPRIWPCTWKRSSWDQFLSRNHFLNRDYFLNWRGWDELLSYLRLGKYFPFCAERCRLGKVVFSLPRLDSGLYTFENMAVNLEYDIRPPGNELVLALHLKTA
jgi:hypothetical protein